MEQPTDNQQPLTMKKEFKQQQTSMQKIPAELLQPSPEQLKNLSAQASQDQQQRIKLLAYLQTKVHEIDERLNQQQIQIREFETKEQKLPAIHTDWKALQGYLQVKVNESQQAVQILDKHDKNMDNVIQIYNEGILKPSEKEQFFSEGINALKSAGILLKTWTQTQQQLLMEIDLIIRNKCL